MTVRLVVLSIITFVVVLLASDSLLTASCAVLAGWVGVMAGRVLERRRRRGRGRTRA